MYRHLTTMVYMVFKLRLNDSLMLVIFSLYYQKYIFFQTFTSIEDIFDVSGDESDDEALPVDSGMLNGVLQGVVECDVYLSCPKSACSNTKLVTVKCDDDIYRMSCKSCNNMFMGSACNN